MLIKANFKDSYRTLKLHIKLTITNIGPRVINKYATSQLSQPRLVSIIDDILIVIRSRPSVRPPKKKSTKIVCVGSELPCLCVQSRLWGEACQRLQQFSAPATLQHTFFPSWIFPILCPPLADFYPRFAENPRFLQQY